MLSCRSTDKYAERFLTARCFRTAFKTSAYCQYQCHGPNRDAATTTTTTPAAAAAAAPTTTTTTRCSSRIVAIAVDMTSLSLPLLRTQPQNSDAWLQALGKARASHSEPYKCHVRTERQQATLVAATINCNMQSQRCQQSAQGLCRAI